MVIKPVKLFSYMFLWTWLGTRSGAGKVAFLSLERLSITFTSNTKREFVPCNQVSPLLVAYCSLSLHINEQFHEICYPSELSDLFLSANFLFWKILNLNLTFAVYVKLKLSILILLTNKTLHWFIPSQFVNKKQRTMSARSGSFQHKLQHRYLLSLLFVAFYDQSPSLTMVNCTASFLRL